MTYPDLQDSVLGEGVKLDLSEIPSYYQDVDRYDR